MRASIIPARVTLVPSGRTIETTLPHHPNEGRDMEIKDGDRSIRIRVAQFGDNPSDHSRGPMVVEAVEL
jgi:hypothetical protein